MSHDEARAPGITCSGTSRAEIVRAASCRQAAQSVPYDLQGPAVFSQQPWLFIATELSVAAREARAGTRSFPAQHPVDDEARHAARDEVALEGGLVVMVLDPFEERDASFRLGLVA